MRRITVPLPGMELGHVNAYLVDCGGEYGLIDVGIATYEAAVGLLRGLRAEGVRPSDIGYVFITHFHADHTTLLPLLSELTAADCYIGEEELKLGRSFEGFVEAIFEEYRRHGIPGALLDEVKRIAPMVKYRRAFEDLWRLPWRGVKDGELLPCGLKALWTPGHTPGHIVYVSAEGAYTGDHILPKITPNISWWYRAVEGFEPLAEYLKSLKKTRGLRRGFPAHGDVINELDKRIDELLRHHEERLADVLSALDRPMTAFEVAGRMHWDMGPFNSLDSFNKFFAIGEALSHLRYLESLGEVEAAEVGGTVVWRRRS